MRWFVLGVALVCVALCVCALHVESQRAYWVTALYDRWLAVILIGLVPALSAWLGGEVARFRAVPRIMAPSSRRNLASGLMGLLVGVAGAIVGALGLLLLDRWLPDALILGVSFFACGVVGVGLQARAKPGQCLACGYDLSGNTIAIGLKCPECGRDAH